MSESHANSFTWIIAVILSLGLYQRRLLLLVLFIRVITDLFKSPLVYLSEDFFLIHKFRSFSLSLSLSLSLSFSLFYFILFVSFCFYFFIIFIYALKQNYFEWERKRGRERERRETHSVWIQNKQKYFSLLFLIFW